mgnify:CR=1 FL=1
MISVEKLNDLCKNTLMETLDIEYLEVSEGRISARMPVNSKTFQPMKRLHGGAIMALAESVASAGSLAMVDASKVQVLGTEISGSHVNGATDGFVTAEATILNAGRTSHLWEIRIVSDSGKLISVCRMTNRLMPVK